MIKTSRHQNSIFSFLYAHKGNRKCEKVEIGFVTPLDHRELHISVLYSYLMVRKIRIFAKPLKSDSVESESLPNNWISGLAESKNSAISFNLLYK